MDKDFETEVLTRLTRLETKVDDYNGLKTKVEELRSKVYSNERRINEIEDKLKWLERTTLGAIITGVISIITIVIKLGLGV
jgi:predicted  nucleic acid-binding Zn-ribbon protein